MGIASALQSQWDDIGKKHCGLFIFSLLLPLFVTFSQRYLYNVYRVWISRLNVKKRINKVLLFSSKHIS